MTAQRPEAKAAEEIIKAANYPPEMVREFEAAFSRIIRRALRGYYGPMLTLLIHCIGHDPEDEVGLKTISAELAALGLEPDSV